MTTQNHSIDWNSEVSVHRDWMLRLARFRLNDPHASEDVVQDILLSVVRQKPDLECPSKLRSWLYQAVVRRSADHIRKRYRRDHVTDKFSQTLDEPPTDRGLDWVLAREQHTQLRAAIQNLTEEDRTLLLLKFTKNWSYKKLGEHFGIAERAVEYRLVCAKRQLRAELTKTSGFDHE